MFRTLDAGADGIKLFTGGLATPDSVVVMDTEIVRAATRDVPSNGRTHTADGASNGVEGLEKVTGNWFDLVITDPRDAGDERRSVRRRRQADAARQAHRHAHRIRRAHGARGERPTGVDVIVSKPVTRSELQRAVSQAIAR